MKHLRTSTARRARRLARVILAGVAIALLVSWNFTTNVTASAGDIDAAFGIDGKVITDFGASAWGRSLVIQPDGKLVMAGFADGDFALARYNTDGGLDPAFGSGGKVITDFGADDNAHAAAILPDGRIVAVGSTWDGDLNIAMSCYNPDGSLDDTFGTAGRVITLILGYCMAQALAIQPDGKLIVAGRAGVESNAVFALARYNPDGSLDPTFGSAGIVTTDLRKSIDEIYDVAILPDGHIVAAGISQRKPSSDTSDFALVRYNSDGSLDTTFGTGGRVIKDFFGRDDSLTSLAVQSDGRLVVAGYAAQDSGDPFFTFVRYSEDGSLDSTFGEGGLAITHIRGYFGVCALGIQPDGRILGAGPVHRGGAFSDDLGLIRLNFDGSLDVSFGSDGLALTDFFGLDDGANALVVTPDGRIVVAGYAKPNLQTRFVALSCYQNDLESAPLITGAEVIGKELHIYGTNFDEDATIYVGGTKQKTANDEFNPTTFLISKKAGKRISRGETVAIQVRNGGRRLSNELLFTRTTE
jgi:uncharacterized delta-60 repeat protein